MTLEDLALQLTPGIGLKGAVHLLECFGTAERIFAATEEELLHQAELRPEPARQILRRSGFAAAEKEIKYCRKHDIKAIASTDPEYPALLREIPDYPAVIYIMGDPDVLTKRCLSVVGTRDYTPYGQHICNKLVLGLAEQVKDLAIVSGTAYGVDITSHRAALCAGIPSVAVLPCALPHITPADHTLVVREILKQGGALLSELHSQSRLHSSIHIARNRLIAALSAGCVVVESPDGGGSLITARFADEYNRTVMAVPGRATDRTSSGTNHLIRNRKAQLVLSAEDIIAEMGWDLDPTFRRPAPETPSLTHEEAELLACFRTSDPLSVDALREQSGLDPGALAALLLGLELAGAIRQLPGNRYMKLSD